MMKEFIDKLISRLQKEQAKMEDKRLGYEYESPWKDCYSKVKEIVNQIAEEYRQDLDKNSQGWIPCSERLPERFAEYIVMIEGAEKPTTLYYCPEDECPWQDDENDYNVIAWQPLPPKFEPKGE